MLHRKHILLLILLLPFLLPVLACGGVGSTWHYSCLEEPVPARWPVTDERSLGLAVFTTIGSETASQSNPYESAKIAGARQRAKELGLRLDILTVYDQLRDGYEQAYVDAVQKMIDEGVDVLSIQPVDTQAATAAVVPANTHDVPVLVHDSITPIAQGEVTSCIGQDWTSSIEQLADHVCTLVADKHRSTLAETSGVVAMMGFGDDEWANWLSQAFEARIQRTCPLVTALAQDSFDYGDPVAKEEGVTWFREHPEIDALFGVSDGVAYFAAAEAQSAGRRINKDLFVVGVGGDVFGLDSLKKGDYSATVAVDPCNYGAAIVDQMAAVLRGEDVAEVLVTPTQLVTPRNFKEFLAGKLWSEPVAAAPE